ncbi:cholesterol 25-hydroxylase-like [Lineus longissimus]|uniref:cholesterol 25-hydroxylase-like n=1 Tax=Lineus longissimus TaxID=88925 RepID=UPI002B4CDE48
MGSTRQDDDATFVRRIHHSTPALWFFRGCWIASFLIYALRRDLVQYWVERSWEYLYSSWLFNCVYFETWWTTLIYTFNLAFARFFAEVRYFDRFKINPSAKCLETDIWRMLLEAVEYCTPLMLLDTFMVKKYKGVGIDPKIWAEKRQSIVQESRVLPRDPPQVEAIVCHIILAVLIYDAIFYVIHFLIHRNMWLYKWVHAAHHTHGVLNTRITNLLSVPERIILVLSANEALKTVSAHPLTRFLFVPVFVGLLCENHCGYDFPWSYDKLLPKGVAGGAYLHYKHHMNGCRHYQPFLTYLDELFTGGKPKKKKAS